jgi:hypothetical protein
VERDYLSDPKESHVMTDSMTNTDIYQRTPGHRLTKAGARASTFFLTHVVGAAVRNIDHNAIKPLPRHGSGGACDAKRLLAVLAWSYARELYSSAQILCWLGSEQNESLWEDGVPDLSEIRRFRNDNRAAVQVCVLAALRFMAAQKLAEGVVTRINESFLAAEAARRIVTAMFIDSAEEKAPIPERALVPC